MQNKKNVWIIFYISSHLNYRIYSEHSQYKFVVFSEPRQGKGVIDTNANNIFDNVSRRAVEKGISINSLEEKAGIATGSIYKWKTASPTVRTVSKVAEVLGCSVDDLLE